MSLLPISKAESEGVDGKTLASSWYSVYFTCTSNHKWMDKFQTFQLRIMQCGWKIFTKV